MDKRQFHEALRQIADLEAELDKIQEALVNETAKRMCLERGFDLYGPTMDVYCEDDPDCIYPWASFRNEARAALKGET